MSDTQPDALRASLQSVDQQDDTIEIVVRVSNTARRALHYIANVRTTKYDPATKTLTIGLSDQGREIIPTTVALVPNFRHVDPGSDAEIHLQIPSRIIKLSRTAPPGEIAFETHQLSEVEEVIVDIAWSDVPYYVDTRKTNDARLPAARWEQHTTRATMRLNTKRKRKRE